MSCVPGEGDFEAHFGRQPFHRLRETPAPTTRNRHSGILEVTRRTAPGKDLRFSAVSLPTSSTTGTVAGRPKARRASCPLTTAEIDPIVNHHDRSGEPVAGSIRPLNLELARPGRCGDRPGH